MNRAVDFSEAGGKRQHEDDGVEDRPGEQAMGAGGETDGFTEALAGRKFLAIGPAEFDARDETALADFVDERVAGFQGGELVAEAGDFLRKVGEGSFAFENIEARKGGGAA